MIDSVLPKRAYKRKIVEIQVLLRTMRFNPGRAVTFSGEIQKFPLLEENTVISAEESPKEFAIPFEESMPYTSNGRPFKHSM